MSYKKLESFFENGLPSVEEVVEKLTFGAYEIEGIEEVGDDKIIDVDVLPNRASDSLSHAGIAREISILTGIPMKHRPLEKKPKLSPRIKEELSINIDDPLLCPVYTIALIRGVKVGPSPDWIKERLEAMGHKSINNIVDATNYVMFGMGQPLHAFDAKKFTEKNNSIGIGVRPAKNGEKITVLGGDEYELTDEMTVITDGNSDEAIAIAGVKGGAGTEVDDSTVDIVVESAKFNPVVTRKTSQALNLRTDASKRFENEIPYEFPFIGIEIVVELILKIAGGKLVGYAGSEIQKSNPYKLGVSKEEVNKILGTNLSDSEIGKVLENLGFEYEKVENPVEKVLKLAKSLKGKPYKYGASVSKDAPESFDCSSFTAWLFAQVGISLPRVSIDQYIWGSVVEVKDLKQGDLVFSNSKSGKIWEETQEFVSGTKVDEGVDHVGIFIGEGKIIHASRNGGEGKVIVENLEKSLSFDNTVGYRRMINESDGRFIVDVPFERLDLRIPADLIEEIGRVHGYGNIKDKVLPKVAKKIVVNKKYFYSEKIRDTLTEAGFTEMLTYSLKNQGEIALANALASDKDHLRSNLTDSVLEVLEQNKKNAPLLGLYDSVNIFEIGNVFKKSGEETHVCIASTKKDALEKAEKIIGDTLGVILKSVKKGGAVEFNLSELIEDLSPAPGSYEKISNVATGATFKPISQYPFLARDIAVWVPEGTTSDVVLGVISKKAGNMLVREDIFDEYKKDGRVSYAFHLVFQSSERTLTDTEINSVMDNIESDLKNNGWEVR